MPQTVRNRDDFTLRIVVTEPEPGPAPDPELDEDGVPTKPFKKAMLGVIQPVPKLRPKPEPLSLDDHERVMRRVRAVKRIAWARKMLQKFQFVQA